MFWLLLSIHLTAGSSSLVASKDKTTVTLNNGVAMPRISLGTCCGSDPSVGLPAWLEAGGVGIDTAWDYLDQPKIGAILTSAHVRREDVFITTKIPAGLGNKTACDADASVALGYVRENLHQLGMDYVDLVLLHGPCEVNIGAVNATASNNALWQGLNQALEQGLTRAIGVSNYKVPQLKALTGKVPAVNQCEMSIEGSFFQPGVDNETIAYCAANGIRYESYGTLKGCPWTDEGAKAIASAHSRSLAQVCLRWALQRGAVVAAGTGANATTVASYAQDNLAVYDFELTDDEMRYLNAL